MSDVDRKEVENKLGNNELPEMLNHTPGVYAYEEQWRIRRLEVEHAWFPKL